jgi:hypothetical protein
MFDRYFGIPQHVIRSGLWANMKPSQQSLYICLMHESERCSTRLLRRPDASLCELSGLSSRAFCDARKKLQEIGLIQCRRGAGNIYLNTICNPENGLPWPGAPKGRFLYRRKGTPSVSGTEDQIAQSPIKVEVPRSVRNSPQIVPAFGDSAPLTRHGVAIKF